MWENTRFAIIVVSSRKWIFTVDLRIVYESSTNHLLDVGDYVTALFGDVETSFSRAVFEKSEGNPFFMVELLRPCVHSNAPQVKELGFSTFALDIVRNRVYKLTSEARRTLSAAAVIGREFDLSILSYVTEYAEDTLLDLLKQPLADNTVVTSPEDQRQLTFDHELIRKVLFEDLNAKERKSWHLRAGECLEKRRRSGSEVATAQLAHHFLSALPHGDVAKAVTYADNAAREAVLFFAYADAVAWLHRAIRTLKLEEHPDLQLLCSLLLNLSFATRATGDNRYSDYLNQAIAIATENGFGRLLAMAGLTLNLAPGIPAMPGALRVLKAAEHMLLDEDKQERAMILTYLAWTSPNCMNTGRVNELLNRAMALARDSGSLLAITTVLRGKLFFTGNPLEYPAAQAIIDELGRTLAHSSSRSAQRRARSFLQKALNDARKLGLLSL